MEVIQCRTYWDGGGKGELTYRKTEVKFIQCCTYILLARQIGNPSVCHLHNCAHEIIIKVHMADQIPPLPGKFQKGKNVLLCCRFFFLHYVSMQICQRLYFLWVGQKIIQFGNRGHQEPYTLFLDVQALIGKNGISASRYVYRMS